MKSLLLVLAVLLVGCGGGKQEETQGPSSPEPTTTPQATLPTKPQPATPTPPQATLPTEPQPPPNTTSWVSDPSDPNNVKIETEIRAKLYKPKGELTQADLEEVPELELDSKQLTDVTDLEKLSQLKSLHLPHNKLTDVKGLEKLTRLKELVLDDNQLTDVKGLKNLTKLEGLWLPRNQLTDVKGLEKLTRLKELDLEDNPDLTKVQIDQLQKALPKCSIRSNPKN